MLTPLQSAQSTAAVSAMQSIVETIEDRRREEAEKASGQKKDEIRAQAELRSDDTARQANARINEHFFGSNARGGDTLAKLISRFSETLGVSQQDGETARAFAQRLADKLTPLESGDVAVCDIDLEQQRELHRRYELAAIPTTVIADDEGVVRKAFVGAFTATDLWAAVAELRDPGTSPEPDLGEL